MRVVLLVSVLENKNYCSHVLYAFVCMCVCEFVCMNEPNITIICI